MRRSVVLGSIAVHAALAALLYAIDRRAPEPEPRLPIDIEIVAPPLKQDPGGGAPGAPSIPAAPAPAADSPAPAPRPIPAPAPRPRTAPAGERLAISGYDHPAASLQLGGTDRGAPGGGGGEGTGFGGGRGAGIGLGTGGGVGELPALPPPPPPPPAPPPPDEKPPSKARPPKLVYPKRDRDGEESETFVARLTVDTDGYVVGARLVRGIGGPRDELASQLVWRFRYAPALDDDGHAVRATIEQRFLVGH